MPPDLLALPTFQRLADYFGLWAVEPERFAAQWRVVRGMDFARHMAAGPPPKVSSLELVAGRDGMSVAVVKAVGLLMKQQSSLGGTSSIQLRRDIRQAAGDPKVSGILLAIDSPGGTVAGTADLATDVAAARRKKPVYAHIDDLGASAAYWIASQADLVYANSPTALVGSIGTLQVVYDESAAAEAAGVKTLVFRTGPLKGSGVPGAPVTDEQKAAYQKLVDETQVHFDAGVRKGRGMNQAQLNAVRTGGVFLADEAQRLKLIDGVQPLAKTLADLAAAK